MSRDQSLSLRDVKTERMRFDNAQQKRSIQKIFKQNYNFYLFQKSAVQNLTKYDHYFTLSLHHGTVYITHDVTFDSG